MASKSVVFTYVNRFRNCSSFTRSFTIGKIIYNKPPTENVTSSIPEVPGLSEACVKVSSEPVGPGATKNSNYKNPEYFCYDQLSYYEAEVEMSKYRCPQPSTKKPYYPKSQNK